MKTPDVSNLDVEQTVAAFTKYAKSMRARYFISAAVAVLVWLAYCAARLFALIAEDANPYVFDIFFDTYFLKSLKFIFLAIAVIALILFVRVTNLGTKIYMKLYSILAEDCDPKKYIAVSDRLTGVHHFRKVRTNRAGYHYVAALMYEGQYEQALAHIQLIRENHTEAKSEHRAGVFYEGRILADMGRVDEAKEKLYVLKGLPASKDPNNVKGKAEHGQIVSIEGAIAFAQQDYQTAASLFKEAVRAFPQTVSKVSLNYRCGEIEYMLGDYAEAMAHYGAALEIKPDAKMIFMDDCREKYNSLKANFNEAVNKPEN